MPTARLSIADQSYLAFEAPETPMHEAAIVWLDAVPLIDANGQPELGEIRHQVERRLERLPRLRQVVRGGSLVGRAMWVDAAAFEIAQHVTATTLDAPGTEEQLLECAARIFMDRLDRGRPLWELHVVCGLGDGRAAVVIKIHHAIAGDSAAVRLFSTLLDTPPDASRPAPPASSPRPVTRPRGRFPSALATARGYASVIATLNRAPPLSIDRPVGMGRRLAAVRLSLAEMKSVAHATGTKVNDVFLTLAAAGAAAILAHRGEAVPRAIIASVFIGLRTNRTELGNEAGVIAVPLEVGERDPRRMLALVAASTAAAKMGQPAAGLAAITHLVTRIGLGRILYRYQRQVNIFTTNVVGPAATQSLFGAKVLDVAAVTPLAGNVALSFAALSYAGRLNVTIIGDAVACPEVDEAAAAMRRTWEALRSSASAVAAP